jgi:hypothetical protein
MYRIALILGLLVTPAVADENIEAERAKNKFIVEKATSDIQKHFESKNLKATLVELDWSCSFKNVACTASNELKLTGHAIVVAPGGNPQVAECEATANQKKTDVVSSCRLFTRNLKFPKDECAVVETYFRYCAEEEPINGNECYPADVGYKWLRWGKNSIFAIEQRHHLPYSRLTPEQGTFDGLCMKVCHKELTAEQAFHKFCRRHPPASYVDTAIVGAEAAIMQHYSRGKIDAANSRRLAAPLAKVLKPRH